MLIKSSWTFSVLDRISIPKTYGIGLAKELHDRMGLELGSDRIPPLTFSGVLGRCETQDDIITFLPQQTYTIVMCGLRQDTAKAIAALDLGTSLALMGVEFQVAERCDSHFSYEDAYTFYVGDEPEPIDRIKLEFLSPTSFAHNFTQLPLPVPSLMFRSWLERWNEFAPIYLGGNELLDYLSQAVVIERHSIFTRSFRLPRGAVKGFMGKVTLRIRRSGDPILANVANLLTYFAQFAGTGMKTRLGMGHTSLDLPTQ